MNIFSNLKKTASVTMAVANAYLEKADLNKDAEIWLHAQMLLRGKNLGDEYWVHVKKAPHQSLPAIDVTLELYQEESNIPPL